MPIPETGTRPADREGGGGLDISSEQHGGAVVLTLHGDLDMRTVPRLRSHLAQALEHGAGAVVVDLSAVAFIDSTGLAALLNALRRLTRAGRRLSLVAPDGGSVLRMLRLTRLDSTFVVHGSRDEALARAGAATPTAAAA